MLDVAATGVLKKAVNYLKVDHTVAQTNNLLVLNSATMDPYWTITGGTCVTKTYTFAQAASDLTYSSSTVRLTCPSGCALANNEIYKEIPFTVKADYLTNANTALAQFKVVWGCVSETTLTKAYAKPTTAVPNWIDSNSTDPKDFVFVFPTNSDTPTLTKTISE